jgi:23S rRNA pseudouridine1911/1915/1917 synthase
MVKKRGRERGQHSGKRAAFPREIPVVYEDDFLVVLNKPPGLLAVPIPGSDAPSALSILSAELRQRRERAFIVHRIDRFASGALLFAKTRSARDALIKQFLAHTPVREYLAVVRGHLREKEGTLVHYFRREGMFQKMTSERDRKGARAELRYRVEQQLEDATLVKVRLITGLQNQIRVQFATIGHPIVGDRKYSREEANEQRIARVALHAAHLEFEHPAADQRITVECEPLKDFQALVKALS